MATYGYDPNVDYQELINRAVAEGDMARAAIFEAQRNEKIAGTGMTGVQQSSKYAAWLPGEASRGYTNPYQEDLDRAIAGMTDIGAYKQNYLRAADNTQKDTLAKYATMTGGVPSTAAVAAASQAADATKAQLDAKIQGINQANASLLMSAGQMEQNRYQSQIANAMSRWQALGYADRDVAAVLGVPIGTATTDQAYTNWAKGQQEMQNQQALAQQAKSDAYTYAMTLIKAGQMPDADTLATAGISQEIANGLLGITPGQDTTATYDIIPRTDGDETATDGMDGRRFGALQSNIAAQLSKGKAGEEEAWRLVLQYDSQLNDAQHRALVAMIGG